MQPWLYAIQKTVDRHFGEIIAVRHHIRAHPELSGEENDTSLYLYQKLSKYGFAPRIGPEGRGVIVDGLDVANQQPHALLALRADIDALRIQDQKTVDYRSQCPGVMHACGHDAHTAVCLGTLLVLQDLAQAGALPWPVQVRCNFSRPKKIVRALRK